MGKWSTYIWIALLIAVVALILFTKTPSQDDVSADLRKAHKYVDEHPDDYEIGSEIQDLFTYYVYRTDDTDRYLYLVESYGYEDFIEVTGGKEVWAQYIEAAP